MLRISKYYFRDVIFPVFQVVALPGLHSAHRPLLRRVQLAKVSGASRYNPL